MAQPPTQPERWLRGPLPDVPTLLQPAAHALLQAKDDVQQALAHFPDSALWERPAGVASVGFHLQHIAGVQDRLLTYARGERLSEAQFAYLKQEGQPGEGRQSVAELLDHLGQQTDRTLAVLGQTDVGTLADFRAVGRAGLPSTVGGLLFHAAEHTMRHTGQLLVTAMVLMKNEDYEPHH